MAAFLYTLQHLLFPTECPMTVQPRTLNEPTISCPSCKTDIKLNESLAAPLIAATRE
ncbi:MAG: DUF2130 domain-containing protein, partial [Mesorhizobium sp.]